MQSFAPPGALIPNRRFRAVFFATLIATFAVSLMLGLRYG